MKRTTIYLPDDLHKALRREALERDMTMAEIIRKMGEAFLERGSAFWEGIDRIRASVGPVDVDEAEAEILSEVRAHRKARSKKPRT